MPTVGSFLVLRQMIIGLGFSEAPRAVTNFVRAHLGEGRAAHVEGLPADPAYMLVGAESALPPH